MEEKNNVYLENRLATLQIESEKLQIAINKQCDSLELILKEIIQIKTMLKIK
jgi:hypothetical protein